MSEEVIIYLPEMRNEWLLQCIEHCDRKDYIYSLIVGDDRRVRETIERSEGAIRTVVVARADHLQPWLPLLEVVGDDTRRISRETADAVRNEAAQKIRATASSSRTTGKHRREARRTRRPGFIQ